MTAEEPWVDLLRSLVAPVLGSLVRRYGDLTRCEDAVQEALLDAFRSWSKDGAPEHPLGWLRTVASRRYADQVRADSSRTGRELAAFAALPRDALVEPGPDAEQPHDDSLELLFMCCHPTLTASAQLALTLRAVGGLTTREIAAASHLPEKTVGQRISRAKQRLRDGGARFELPPDPDRGPRLQVVLHVLYLVFNEGYSASNGAELHRPDLTRRAVELVERLHARLPEDGEVAGLLALMLLSESRTAARVDQGGLLVPLAEQDRSRWDQAAIARATTVLTSALSAGRPGPYQVQAAIAAVHAEAPSVEATDWPQVLALYGILERMAPNPFVTLNRAVAVGMVHGPRAGLDLVDELESGALAGHHRLLAVRAHLLERAGDTGAAATAYQEAARLAGSVPEEAFLLERAASL